jgi:phenylpropionate dioxygenase-like ring-hydroxylating dioxygenase large terminal subunit
VGKLGDPMTEGTNLTSEQDAVETPGASAPRRARLANLDPALRHCWHPVARSAEVTAHPRRVELLGEALALVRLDGEVAAFADSCPHRLAPLSAGRVVDNVLECPYHGWRFDRTGRCVEVPSIGAGRPVPGRARCVAPRVVEHAGLVFVALAEPVVDLPEFVSDAGAEIVDLSFEGTFGAGMLIDNQLDIAHFPFLHRATFGSPDGELVPAYEVVRAGLGFSTRVEIPFIAANDPLVEQGDHPLQQIRVMSYRYVAPFFLDLCIEYPQMGGTMRLAFVAQPMRSDRARLFVTIGFAVPGGLTAAELADRIAFEERVIAEDLDLQARFVTQALPIDVRIETHVRADRQSLEFRRILQDLLVAADSADEAELASEIAVARL